MKCQQCGGRLEGDLTECPFCGTRQDIDLQQIHYRDLGHEGSLPCPGCEATLALIEFDTDPPIRIERCDQCLGMFFNPGELVALMEANTNPVVWLDRNGLADIARRYDNEREVVYRQCPMCRQPMSHFNFGARSGVVLDRCTDHGVWVEGGELRRLMEWWRAGGKHFHAASEREKAARLHRATRPSSRRLSSGRPEAPGSSGRVDWSRLNREDADDDPDFSEALRNTILDLLAWVVR